MKLQKLNLENFNFFPFNFLYYIIFLKSFQTIVFYLKWLKYENITINLHHNFEILVWRSGRLIHFTASMIYISLKPWLKRALNLKRHDRIENYNSYLNSHFNFGYSCHVWFTKVLDRHASFTRFTIKNNLEEYLACLRLVFSPKKDVNMRKYVRI